jgi:uncharacterized protein (TIGR02611 family)
VILRRLAKDWADFKNSAPGERFERRYRAGVRSGGVLRKVLVVGSGLIVIAAGIILLPAPGPGTLIIAFGAGLIAQESLLAARVLDWLEVRLRKLVRRSRSGWKRSSLPLRVALVVLLLVLAGGAVLGTYRWLFAG